jgi:hypothetical protein
MANDGRQQLTMVFDATLSKQLQVEHAEGKHK